MRRLGGVGGGGCDDSAGLAGEDEGYLRALLDLGCAVDAWETTYLHLLPGKDPVFRWVVGTGARPRSRRSRAAGGEFEEELRSGLRAAYPPGPHGTVLPFRWVFVVAQRS